MSRLNHVEFVRSLRWAKMWDIRMEEEVKEEEIEEDESKSRKRGREALRTASDAHEF